MSSVAIQIERGGGDLTTEQILYRIIPSGNTLRATISVCLSVCVCGQVCNSFKSFSLGSDDFIGASSLVTFAPTNRTMSVDVAAALDDIPEINETFTFEIYSMKDNVVSPSNVSITILANDDWNGVFSFNSSSVSQTIGMIIITMYTIRLCKVNVIHVLCTYAKGEQLRMLPGPPQLGLILSKIVLL